MQLQSSLFSRGVLLGLHDFSIQSTVVFLIINFLTSYFCKRLSFFICKFCQQALLVFPRLFMRSFRFSSPRGRRSFSSHARKKPLPKVAEVFCRRAAVSTAVLTTTPCARWAPNEKKMRFLRGWSAAICFSCLSAWLVPIFFLRYRHKNKKMTRKVMFYPVLIQKQRELVYCYQTRGWV